MVFDDADDARSVWILGICLVSAVVVYSPILGHGSVYEDAAWPLFQGSESWWQPGHLLAKTLWVPTPLVMHGVSLLLHLTCGVLVFALALALKWPLPGVVAGLFLLHPLNSEAVAYASAFSHLIATAFILLALTLFAERGLSLVVVIFAVLAMHANPSGVVVFGLLALLWWRDGGRIEDHASLVVLGLVLLVGAVWLAQGRYALPGSEAVSWTHWWSLQATALLRLVGLAIYPIGFSVDPGVELAPIWLLMLAGGTLAGVCAWAAYCALDPERPNGLFALAWVLVAILPRFVVRAPLAILSEHQFYTASIGLALGGAWILNSAKTHVVDKQNLKVVP